MLKALREKRGEAVQTMREVRDAMYLDDKGKKTTEPRALTAEETTKFQGAERDYDAITEQINLAERMEKIDGESKTVEEERTAAQKSMSKTGETIDEETRCLAFQAWAIQRAGGSLTEKHRSAIKRVQVTTNQQGEALMSLPRSVPQSLAEARALNAGAESRDLEVGTDNEGGYTVPTTLIRNLEIARLANGPALAEFDTMRTAAGESMQWPSADDTDETGELVEEEGAVTADTSTPFGQTTFGAYKWSSKMIKVSAELLEDSAFDLATVVGQLIGGRLGRGELGYMTTGTGDSQPNGIVTALAAIAATSGLVDSQSATLADPDDIYNLIYGIDDAYIANAKFMMHRTTISRFRKLVDTDGQYMWQPSVQKGEPETIGGYPIIRNSKMASTWTNGIYPVVFGDLKKYKIREVNTLRMKRLNELYAANDQVGFIGFLRFDGDLLDAGTHPVKALNVIAGS